MAEEAKAVIVLAAGEAIETGLTIDQIAQTLQGHSPEAMSYFKVTDVDGLTHWINALQVVQIHEPSAGRGGFL